MAATKTKAFQHGNKSLISITVDTDQVVSLDEIASKQRTSRAAVIRTAIDQYLTKHQNDKDKVAA